MNNYSSIEKVAEEIQQKFKKHKDKKTVLNIFAFNSTGKTRITKILEESLQTDEEDQTIQILSYNAYFEDIFTWDNEEFVINFDPSNFIVRYIIDQGLENQITELYQRLTLSKIIPDYDLANGSIAFNYSPGDDRSIEQVKISRGEESVFVWSVFLVVVESVIEILNIKQVDNRDTDTFNNLEYIIIDDPVSSIDDTKVISIAFELARVINNCTTDLNFLITTHHALFYNVIHNKNTFEDCHKTNYLLSKTKEGYQLKKGKIGEDSPFAYHIEIIKIIKEAIDQNDLQRYHFNLFRVLLEKTANFLGYEVWNDCLGEDLGDEIKRLAVFSNKTLNRLK
jgi:hypothetical protein